MTAPSQDAARTALMLTELRLPTIGRLWPAFADRSDKEAWPAARFLGGLLEHELAERAKRRIERHRAESLLDVTKTLCWRLSASAQIWLRDRVLMAGPDESCLAPLAR